MAVYRELLLTLGSTGLGEARQLIDVHFQSPDDDFRDAAHEALRLWVIRNGMLVEGGKLPEYPSEFHLPSPPLPPGVPGAHTLVAWLATPPGQVPARRPGAPPSAPRPPVLADTPPPGFYLAREPNWTLTAVSGVWFASAYTSVAIPTFIALGNGSDEYGAGLLPIVGPFIAIDSANLFGRNEHEDGEALRAGWGLAVGGALQIGAAITLALSLIPTRETLARDQADAAPRPSAPISFSPRGAAVRFDF